MSDEIVLGRDCVLQSDAERSGINENVVVIGGTGTGKSLSLLEPTLLRAQNRSLVCIVKKQEIPHIYGKYFAEQGYEVMNLNLSNPAESTNCFDPMDYIRMGDYTRIKALADAIMDSDPDGTHNYRMDPYWEQSGSALLAALMSYCMDVTFEADFPDVVRLVNQLSVMEENSAYGSTTTLDPLFNDMRERKPDSQTIVWWDTFCSLPDRTARCVLGSLRTRMSTIFTAELMDLMKKKPGINLRKLGQKKSVLFITISPVNPMLHLFANLVLAQLIQTLFELGEGYPDGRLQVPVRIIADDFANGGAVPHFTQDISIFRSKGISAMMLLQSEAQLDAIYGPTGTTTILDNCDTYVYLGGNDIQTARQVSVRLNAPLEDVMYLPIGKEVVFQRGRHPVCTERYDTLSDPGFLGLSRYVDKDEQHHRLTRVESDNRYWERRFAHKENRQHGDDSWTMHSRITR
ncbi:MAG: type IV secretory system conjugative DNA transfer family protein [Lachnospiraceae bacterium]